MNVRSIIFASLVVEFSYGLNHAFWFEKDGELTLLDNPYGVYQYKYKHKKYAEKRAWVNKPKTI